MASVLNNQNTIFFQFDEEEQIEKPKKAFSCWQQEGNFVSAAENTKRFDKLTPGLYNIIGENGNIFCNKIEISKNQLYSFDDPIIVNIIEELDKFWEKAEVYKQKNRIHKRGVFLDGPSGTGKTSISHLIIDDFISKGGIAFEIKGFRNFISYIYFIKNHLRVIEADRAIITFIEDIDQYEEVDPEMLSFLSGSDSINHNVTIATSNNSESLPDTYLRSCRFDLKVTVENPDENKRYKFLEVLGTEESILDDLAEATEDFSMADLEELHTLIYMFDFPVEDAIKRIKTPHEKINFLDKPKKAKQLGI